jgi:hypothetical protein
METNKTNWLEDEAKNLTQPKQYEELPSLKLTPNVVTEIQIDTSKPFDKWTGEVGNKTITKKIIPVVVNGVRMVWWLNVKNPIYREVVDSCLKGITTFKILQTGSKADTKYVLVK